MGIKNLVVQFLGSVGRAFEVAAQSKRGYGKYFDFYCTKG